MILLLGATGYVGQAFVEELERRGWGFYTLRRKELDYTRFDLLLAHLRENRPEFVVNAAGFVGRPNVDACENQRAETLLGNVVFPQALAEACHVTKIPWGHVSSGCIYSGAKILSASEWQAERDLMKPDLQRLLRTEPGKFAGFTEKDAPNFSFRSPPCSFYSGSKALAEEVLGGKDEGYLWRLRIPFDERDDPRNYITKLLSYPKVYENVNSISHRGEFVRACLDLWGKRAPFGIYNVTNPGWVTTRQVVERMRAILHPAREFAFWESDEEFYKFAKALRSNCMMDSSKLLQAGAAMRPVEEALDDSLRNWRPRP
jgi:dTDP-4-dehydrorhamnose reductase